MTNLSCCTTYLSCFIRGYDLTANQVNAAINIFLVCLPVKYCDMLHPQGLTSNKNGRGSECWALPLTLKNKGIPIQLTTLEFNFWKTEAHEV